MHLDQDVKNTPGSPDLARTILTKIDASQVVVADVTITGRTEGQGVAAGKKLINSNVAIELGYAFHSRGDENVILVLNAHYGAHEDLPFDLRHKGGAVVFDLPPNADKARIEADKKKLIAQFSEKLKPYLQAATTAAAPSFQETPSTYVKAAYFAEGEILAEIGESDDLIEYFYDTKQLAYIRLIPTKGLPAPTPLANLRQEASRIPLLLRGHGGFQVITSTGPSGSSRARFLQKGAQGSRHRISYFKTANCGASGRKYIVPNRGNRPAHLRVPFVHSLTFEQLFYDTLRELISAAKLRLGLSPTWQIELGLVGIDDVHVVGMPALITINGDQFGSLKSSSELSSTGTRRMQPTPSCSTFMGNSMMPPAIRGPSLCTAFRHRGQPAHTRRE